MQLAAKVAVLLISLMIAERAPAQQVQGWNWCQSGVSTDAQINGCTAVIQSGLETPLNLAAAFHMRTSQSTRVRAS
jgi:hypothetical protein